MTYLATRNPLQRGGKDIVITDGAVSRFLMEAAGPNVVYEKLFANRDVKINCAATDWRT